MIVSGSVRTIQVELEIRAQPVTTLGSHEDTDHEHKTPLELAATTLVGTNELDLQ